MATHEATELSKLEYLKESSRQLRGTLAEELASDADHLSGDAKQILKFHGSYQQDDRELRGRKNPDGSPAGKYYIFMVRTRIPGGRLTSDQLLAELDLCDRVGNGTLRITTRQGLQLHGVLKKHLRETIREINRIQLSTFCACGDVERNVMCCPAPIRNNPVRDQMQELAWRTAEHLKPRTTAYYEIWLRDEEGNETDATEFRPVEEPIYGERYLPRKFKTGFALPDDNCIELLANDLGFLGIVENGRLVGFNVYVGGSMGVTPANKNTFPALAKKLTFVTPDQVIPIAEAIVKVQRDFGNRSDRKLARMKYLIADWGLERFGETVAEYYGRPLAEPHPQDPVATDDHMGWHEQGDGRWFLGIKIPNGRIQDTDAVQYKTGLRELLRRYRRDLRLTAQQSLILCDIEPGERADIDAILAAHGIRPAEELTPIERLSIACPALPTCGLAVTESERVMPQVLEAIRNELAARGLDASELAVHMTGCPNGCARTYTSDIGLVGKARGKYTIYLGGNAVGTALGFVYQDLVPLEEIPSRLAPVFDLYRAERRDGESFGDFCRRLGPERLASLES